MDDSKTSITAMRDDIANLKVSVANINARLLAMITDNNLSAEQLEAITVPEPDAPTDEDSDADAPVYSVDNGSLNADMFNADSTATCKHYTYDNLHVIIIDATRKAFTFTDATWYDMATFPNLSSYSGHGYITPLLFNNTIGNGHNRYITRIEGNKIRIKCNGNIASSESTRSEHMCYFWFDRTAQSKLFQFEDGQLYSYGFSINSPNHCVHASIGNLHFLSIQTQSLSECAKDLDVEMCQFTNNLAIPCGAHLGIGCSVPTQLLNTNQLLIKAPSNNKISIRGINCVIPTNAYITINCMWIDARALAAVTGAPGDTIVEQGTTAYDSNDSFARRFNYGHLNVIQAYGSQSTPSESSANIAVFSQTLTNPFTNPMIRDVSLASFTETETLEKKSGSGRKTDQGSFSNYFITRNAFPKTNNNGLYISATLSSYPHATTLLAQMANSGDYEVYRRNFSNHTCYYNHTLLWFA